MATMKKFFRYFILFIVAFIIVGFLTWASERTFTKKENANNEIIENTTNAMNTTKE